MPPVDRADPIRQWQFSTIGPALGTLPVGGGEQVGGLSASDRHEFGPAGTPFGGSAFGTVFSSRLGDHWSVSSQSTMNGGTKSQLTQYQAYTKREPRGAIQFQMTEAQLRLVDLTDSPSARSRAISGRDRERGPNRSSGAQRSESRSNQCRTQSIDPR